MRLQELGLEITSARARLLPQSRTIRQQDEMVQLQRQQDTTSMLEVCLGVLAHLQPLWPHRQQQPVLHLLRRVKWCGCTGNVHCGALRCTLTRLECW